MTPLQKASDRVEIYLCELKGARNESSLFENIDEFRKILNKLQNRYLFTFQGEVWAENAGCKPVELNGHMEFVDDLVFRSLEDKLRQTKFGDGKLIALTRTRLTKNSFNRQDCAKGVGVITAYEMDLFKGTKTDVQYLAFLVLCVAVILETHHQEHHGTGECMFDSCCFEKSNYTKSLTKAIVCDTCLRELKKAGFDGIFGQFTKALAFVRRSDPRRALKMAWVDNEFKLVLGMLISFSIHKLAFLAAQNNSVYLYFYVLIGAAATYFLLKASYIWYKGR